MNEMLNTALHFLAGVGLGFWTTLCQMAPYLLFGFLVAGFLSVLISPHTIERHLGGHGFLPVIKAALFGVPLPLCSCSVIPVTASLRQHGAGRGAMTAFLISTPQTGVDSILVTYSLLGPVFAIFRPVAAFVSGVFGGAMADILEPHGAADTQVVEKCNAPCCAEDGNGKRSNAVVRALRYGFIDLPRDLAGALLIGIAVAGVIGALVKPDQFAAVGTGIGAILVMMLVGIPVYVCATASVPIAAALIHAGVSPGAALAFLMTGPGSNAAGIAMVWKMMGPRTTIVYLASIAVTAVAAGLLLDAIWPTFVPGGGAHVHPEAPGLVHIASAVALLLILVYAAFGSRFRHNHDHEHAHEHGDGEPGHDEEGESCPHCKNE